MCASRDLELDRASTAAIVRRGGQKRDRAEGTVQMAAAEMDLESKLTVLRDSWAAPKGG